MRTRTAILVGAARGIASGPAVCRFLCALRSDHPEPRPALCSAHAVAFQGRARDSTYVRLCMHGRVCWRRSINPQSSQESYKEDRSHEYPVRFFVSGPSYKLLGIHETSTHLFGVAEPGKVLLFGTDGYGRDEFSRVLFGGQISVAAGITATFIALLAGSILGVIAGYYGRLG